MILGSLNWKRYCCSGGVGRGLILATQILRQRTLNDQNAEFTTVVVGVGGNEASVPLLNNYKLETH